MNVIEHMINTQPIFRADWDLPTKRLFDEGRLDVIFRQQARLKVPVKKSKSVKNPTTQKEIVYRYFMHLRIGSTFTDAAVAQKFGIQKENIYKIRWAFMRETKLVALWHIERKKGVARDAVYVRVAREKMIVTRPDVFVDRLKYANEQTAAIANDPAIG